MNLRIADTFVDSLTRLTGDEQKSAKMAAFDLQLDPSGSGFQFHKIERAKDPRFWSIRVTRDLRLIVHKDAANLLLCYVDHHDDAYRWAERRKLETHPKTGAAQLVELRESVQEIPVRGSDHSGIVQQASSPLFASQSDDELLGYGVPRDWLRAVRDVTTDDALLELADHLPGEASEALLELATGGRPEVVKPRDVVPDPFAHPEAQRRFRVMADVDELARALDYPWDKWTTFLHPIQREIVSASYNGPVRISGSAGTGKTVVALQRTVHLARENSGSRVLLATFSQTLANALIQKLRLLVGTEPRIAERIEVHAIQSIGMRLYTLNLGQPRMATMDLQHHLLNSIVTENSLSIPFGPRFVIAEWSEVVDAWQLDTWEAYRDFQRLGRKTRLTERHRAELWGIFEKMQARLTEGDLLTEAALFSRLAKFYEDRPLTPFEFVVVDEAQDLTVAQFRFLAAIGGNRPNGLFFAGDPGQRIFQLPYSWRALGVDIRGRSRILRVNYRTSHQIRRQADYLLPHTLTDADGNSEDRQGIVSVFNGPEPSICVMESQSDEIEQVGAWLAERAYKDGVKPNEVGLFVRSIDEMPRALAASKRADLPTRVLDDGLGGTTACASIGTMHLAKGLEFRVVVVMACDDDVIPLQSRIEAVVDEADLEEIHATERHLLYVACTRARDYLLVTGVYPASEFVEDLRVWGGQAK